MTEDDWGRLTMVRVRLFASAREAAGRRDDELDARTLREAIALMIERYGAAFGAVLETARVWVNGDEPAAGLDTSLDDGDEVAVLPPVSGGSTPHATVPSRARTR